MKSETIITYIFYVLLAVTAVMDVILMDGGKLGRIALTCITILIFRFIFLKTFLRKSKTVYLIVLIFIFISMYLANILNFYGIKYYDKFLHLTSGIILALIGLLIYIYLSNGTVKNGMKKATIIVFPLIFAIAAAGVWEVWEFTTDQLFGLTAQLNNLHDTMWDIICGTIGGGIFSVFIYLYVKGRNIRFLKAILNELKS